MNTRPVRPGTTQASRPAASGRPTRSGRAPEYPTSGSAALAPVYHEEDEVDSGAEPTRTRSVEERAAADERSAQRVADREAGRVVIESRRRLRIAPPMPVNVARAPFVAFLIFIVIAGVVGILVLNTMINANQFRLNHLQAEQATLDQQQQQLQQNLAKQESPGSLVANARKLGLVPAGTLAYIQMPNGTVVGLPGPATDTTSASTGR